MVLNDFLKNLLQLVHTLDIAKNYRILYAILSSSIIGICDLSPMVNEPSTSSTSEHESSSLSANRTSLAPQLV